MSLSAALAFGSALLCAVLAGVTWWKAPPSAVTRLFVAGMGLLAAREALAALYLDGVLPWALWQRALWLAEALIPLVWLLFSLCFGRANWRQLLRRWRWALGAASAFPFALLLSTGGLLGWAPEALAPPGVLLRLNWAGRLLVLWDLLLSLAILANLESTLRAAGGIKRWQVKFVLLGVGSIFAAQVYTDSQSLLFSSLYVRLETVQSCALAAATVLLALGLVRSRLLHVDLYLSRTALYGSLTVLVAGGYLVAVGLLARVIRDVGHSEVLPLSTLFMFLALLGLMVVLLSNQLRQQLKGFVSRHFYRSRYDYRHEWATFTQQTASVLDARALCAVVSRRVAEVFGTPAVSLWLFDAEQDGHPVLGGSTVFSDSEPPFLVATAAGLAELARYLARQPLPLDLGAPRERRAAALAQAYAQTWQVLQVRYAVGLMANQHFLGLMTLSARLTGEPFTPEDTELLKTIADQTAASLLNLQLSERLARSKQLDTLRTMAAFFVHDLKNFAARLSLLMENFETHYHDAAFRAEALRLMRTSVAKMQHMCSRLSLLTARLELRRTATDVNALVRDTVAELRGALSAPVVLELQPLPPAWLDAEQLQKVLVNLLLNANDAVAGQGEIRVRTWQEGGYVVLAVSDNGCGIPAAFLKASLFQPFQTTKRGGLGIGLFHSKMIVEAHRGRIEVESEEGKGSTFRVWLPLATPEEESRDVGQDPAC